MLKVVICITKNECSTLIENWKIWENLHSKRVMYECSKQKCGSGNLGGAWVVKYFQVSNVSTLAKNGFLPVQSTFKYVCYIFASLFSSLKESSCETWRNILYFISKTLSWHQMPKHKTRNKFYWITWEVNTVC